jgi:hypothetical protein
MDQVGYLYIHAAAEGGPDPGAGEMRVHYNFTLTKRDEEGSNAYKDVYALDNGGG